MDIPYNGATYDVDVTLYNPGSPATFYEPADPEEIEFNFELIEVIEPYFHNSHLNLELDDDFIELIINKYRGEQDGY